MPVRVSEEVVLRLFRLFAAGSSSVDAARSLEMARGTTANWRRVYDHVDPVTWKVARRLMPEAIKLLKERGAVLGRRYAPDIAEQARKHVPVLVSGEPLPPPAAPRGQHVSPERAVDLFRAFAAGQSMRQVAGSVAMSRSTVGHWRRVYDHMAPLSAGLVERLAPEAVELLHERGQTLGRRYEPDVTLRAARYLPVEAGSPLVTSSAPDREAAAAAPSRPGRVRRYTEKIAVPAHPAGPTIRPIATLVIEVKISLRTEGEP